MEPASWIKGTGEMYTLLLQRSKDEFPRIIAAAKLFSPFGPSEAALRTSMQPLSHTHPSQSSQQNIVRLVVFDTIEISLSSFCHALLSYQYRE